MTSAADDVMKTKQNGAESPPAINTQSFDFGPWTLTVTKSHIVPSVCQKTDVCSVVAEDCQDLDQLCSFCRYSRQLSLPSLPEMLFADNSLCIHHTAGHGLLFTALDALKQVDAHKAPQFVVACADKWKKSRCDVPGVDSVHRPFDWTFSTDYSGTLVGKHLKMVPETTQLRIDMDKLKQREKIMFYQDVVLYEDELADNGCSLCSVKVRVMARSFFILLRHYLRVDDVLVRVSDTRLYHEAGQDFILREYSVRESCVDQLQVPVSVIIDPNQIWSHLPIVKSQHEILKFPPTP